MSENFETWEDFLEEFELPDALNIPISITIDEKIYLTIAHPRRMRISDITINQPVPIDVLRKYLEIARLCIELHDYRETSPMPKEKPE